MMTSLHPAVPAIAGLAAVLLLAGCELALHEVQQATADGGCEPWQAGCPAMIEYNGREPVHPARADAESLEEIVSAAVETPYRPCDTVGLVCQGRIIGDVLWDQYIMVLASQSHFASTAASARPAIPASGTKPAEPAASSQPAPAPGRIVRTHGTRAGGPATPATSAPPR